MASLPRESGLVAIREYVDTPMIAAERVKFELIMKNAANLDASIWNPLNPHGRCYDPNYKPLMSNKATVVVAKPPKAGPPVRSPSPCFALNSMTSTFDGSSSPLTARTHVQHVTKPVSIDSSENMDRWAKFLSQRLSKSQVMQNSSSSAMEGKSTAPVEGFSSPSTSRLPVVKEAAPLQTIAVIPTSPAEDKSPKTSRPIVTPPTTVTAIRMALDLPAIPHTEASCTTETLKVTDANVQTIWSAWLENKNNGKNKAKTVESTSTIATIKSTGTVVPNSIAAAEPLYPVIARVETQASTIPGTEISAPFIAAADAKLCVFLDPITAHTVARAPPPRAATLPKGYSKINLIKKSSEDVALESWSAAFAKLLATNQPVTSFSHDGYHKHPQEVSLDQSRVNELDRPASPTSSWNPKTSDQSGKINKTTSPPQTTRPTWRHPSKNPRFKFTEDNSVFIAHIINNTRSGKTYTKKENIPNVETAPLEQTRIIANADNTANIKNKVPCIIEPVDSLRTLSSIQGLATAPKAKSTLTFVLPKFVPAPELTEVAKNIVTKSNDPATLRQLVITQCSQPVSQNAAAWQLHPSLAGILMDSTKYAKYLSTLAEATNSTTTGFKGTSETFDDDKISNEGVADIRAEKGNNAKNQLQDWDGTMAPAPVDWEGGRLFDDSFVPEYIKEWVKLLPAGLSVTVNCGAPEFILGEHPINNASFSPPVRQPETVPDSINSEDEKKRLGQTAQNALDNYNNKIAKSEESKNSWRRAQELRYQEIERVKIEGTPDLFAPAIDIYVRPAESKDAVRIRDIYNYYVVNTNIPEDQTEISLDVARNLIQYCQKQKLPILVAVHGKFPPVNTVKTTHKVSKGRGQPQPSKTILPEQEHVIGFSCTEHSAVGLSGSAHGLHRYTADLKLYVDIEYTRKGVGRNLLDHLIHILHFGYGFRNSCRFVNQKNDPVYETGGSGLWHMMAFHIPALKNSDPNLPWLSHWMKNKFKFLPGGILRSWGRTSTIQGPASFVDLHILQCEALQEADIEVNY